MKNDIKKQIKMIISEVEIYLESLKTLSSTVPSGYGGQNHELGEVRHRGIALKKSIVRLNKLSGYEIRN